MSEPWRGQRPPRRAAPESFIVGLLAVRDDIRVLTERVEAIERALEHAGLYERRPVPPPDRRPRR